MPFDGVSFATQELIAGPGERLVHLTKNRVALIDEVDWDRVSARRWYAHQARSNVYARRDASVNGRKEAIYLHRHVVNAEPGWVVDHVNRNSLDCRRSNLRICGFDANAQNAEYRSSTGFRGVTLEAGKYRARLHRNGVTKSLGCYNYPEDAARAYDAAVLEIYGPYAWTNFEVARPSVQVFEEIPF